MRAQLYARTGTEDQNEWGMKVDAQSERLRRYAREQGWEIVGETREPAPSGIAQNRPGLASLLEIACSHPRQFDILLVESFSRLSRDRTGLEIILQRLNLAGIELVCAIEAGPNSPSGALVDALRSTFDEHHVMSIADHIRVRRLAAAHAGHWRDPAPFGYVSVRETDRGRRTLAIHEDEAKVVRCAFQLASANKGGPTRIARHLNDAGHTTRSGKPWSITAVSRMLGNPIYRGIARFKAPLDIHNIAESITGIPISVPPIVSRQLFFAVQRIGREWTARGRVCSAKSWTRR